MFTIKICGLTNLEDAERAISAGADALGFNFYPPSPRYVEPSVAAEISAAVAGQAKRVGVFVNATVAEMRQIAEQVSLDAIQMHGDEPPEAIAELAPWPVIKVFRCRDSLVPVASFLEKAHPAAVLIDAYHPQEYGGTGQRADWELIVRERELLAGLPLILAGGLTPANVAAAIRAVRPAAVDTASGVELSPGKKDPCKLGGFVHAAQQAFDERC